MARKVGYLNLKKTLFLLCDIQEAFRPVMKLFDPMIKNTQKLLEAGKALEIPLVVTEQYPEKLGHTVKEFDIKHAIGVYPKTLFSMAIPEVKNKINEVFSDDLKHIVIMGIETHVCVEQSAMDFLSQGFDVHIAADCSISRSLEDRLLAFDRLKHMGCCISTSENIIFKLLKDKNHPGFNKVRKLISNMSVDTSLASKL